MKIIIVEDELNAFRYLRSLLDQTLGTYQLLHHIESVEDAINIFSSKIEVDLIFMDIQLADGLSFEIFNHVNITKPIIFTTAYDEYALKAFEVNSIDYLLKPIEIGELNKALKKYRATTFGRSTLTTSEQLRSVLSDLNTQKKQRFLVKSGGHFEFIDTNDVAIVQSEDGVSLVYDKNGKRYIYNKTIEQLNDILDPIRF